MSIIGNPTANAVIVNGDAAAGAPVLRPKVAPFADPRTTGWPFSMTNVYQNIYNNTENLTENDWLITDLTWVSVDAYAVEEIEDYVALRDWLSESYPNIAQGVYFGSDIVATRAQMDAQVALDPKVSYAWKPRVNGYFGTPASDDLTA